MQFIPEGTIKENKNSAYRKNGGGWKIHLAVKPQTHKVVYDWLLQNCQYTCKYGRNSGQEGKDFYFAINPRTAFDKGLRELV